MIVTLRLRPGSVVTESELVRLTGIGRTPSGRRSSGWSFRGLSRRSRVGHSHQGYEHHRVLCHPGCPPRPRPGHRPARGKAGDKGAACGTPCLRCRRQEGRRATEPVGLHACGSRLRPDPGERRHNPYAVQAAAPSTSIAGASGLRTSTRATSHARRRPHSKLMLAVAAGDASATARRPTSSWITWWDSSRGRYSSKGMLHEPCVLLH